MNSRPILAKPVSLARWLLIALVTLGSLTTLPVSLAQDSEQGIIAKFDWLVATNGRYQFEEPLLTLNQEDLERFEFTGRPAQIYQLGPLTVEVRTGVFYSLDPDYDDDSLDIPAAVMIHKDDTIIVGAKGFHFRVDTADSYIMIEHWNGNLGCSIARWYLEYKFIDESLDTEVKVVDSEYLDFLSKEPCSRAES